MTTYNNLIKSVQKISSKQDALLINAEKLHLIEKTMKSMPEAKLVKRCRYCNRPIRWFNKSLTCGICRQGRYERKKYRVVNKKSNK